MPMLYYCEMTVGTPRQRARAQTIDEIEAVEIDISQRELTADAVVEERQLAVQLA